MTITFYKTKKLWDKKRVYKRINHGSKGGNPEFLSTLHVFQIPLIGSGYIRESSKKMHGVMPSPTKNESIKEESRRGRGEDTRTHGYNRNKPRILALGRFTFSSLPARFTERIGSIQQIIIHTVPVSAGFM